MLGASGFRSAGMAATLGLLILVAPSGATSQESLISVEVTEPLAYLAGKGIEAATQIYTTAVQERLERDRLAALSDLAAQINRMQGSSADIESLIRSEPVRRFYISATSINGRVAALGAEFRMRRPSLVSPSSREEFVGRLRDLRNEAYRLAFDATPILNISDDDGVQFLVSLRSAIVTWGILETIELQIDTYHQSAEVYRAGRAEFARLSGLLNAQLTREDSLAQSRTSSANQALANMSRSRVAAPLADALRANRRTVSLCVESRSSSFDRQTDADVCIGSRERPVLMGSRVDRETGSTLPPRRTYGCVRYVREMRSFQINPVYRSGTRVGGSVSESSRSVSYHSTSDATACPILREQFESARDWAAIEAEWRDSLSTVYSSGADVALSNTRRELIREIAMLIAALRV